MVSIPIYKSRKYKYIRIKDLKEEYERAELSRWIFGQLQPLIQADGKGEREIQDAVFLEDYLTFLNKKKIGS